MSINKTSPAYISGFENAAICFGYIPDFRTDADKLEYTQGLKDGFARVKELKESKAKNTKDFS